LAEAQLAKSNYEKRFYSGLKQRNAEARARRAAEAGIEWLAYPQAVHWAGANLFGSKWLGPASEHDQVVKRFGAAHPEFEEIARRGRERELQLERTARWLKAFGLVKVVRGALRVPKAALLEALREVGGDRQAAGAASQARPKPKHTQPKRALIAGFIAEHYPHGRLPPLKTIANQLGISPRTVARALGGK
jgi:hypothetical protein